MRDLLYLYNKSPEVTMIAIRLPEQIESRLDRLAKLTGRTKSFYVRQALIEHLDDLEDIYIAEQRIADLKARKSSSIPLEDVLKQYGVADTPGEGSAKGSGAARPTVGQTTADLSPATRFGA